MEYRGVVTEPSHLGAARLVGELTSGSISSRELLEMYIRRVEALNPTVNAVVTLDVEGALRRADEADEALAKGCLLGSLHGLPITVKDTIETEGIRTTAGSAMLAEHRPESDADAVARLRAAGAVVFGKTNTPLFAGDAQSYNDLFGTTENPWSPGRSPGGSSGGSAAALATGLTGLELGSDIGGSIRNPAHYCGVYGHKPSAGLVPTRGHIPPMPGVLSEVDMATIGPLGREADDLQLALDALAGPSSADAVAWRLEMPPPRASSLDEFRVALWLDDPACPVDGAVAATLGEMVDALADGGASIDASERPGLDLAETHRTYQSLNYGVTAAFLPARVYNRLLERSEDLGEDDDSRAARYLRFGTQRHKDWLAADAERSRYKAVWRDFFSAYDVLLCPVVPTTAIAHDHTNINTRTITVNGSRRDYWDQIIWAGMANMAGLPATSAPVGLAADGLPVGVQIIGGYLEDRTTIHFARRLSEVIGGYVHPRTFA